MQTQTNTALQAIAIKNLTHSGANVRTTKTPKDADKALVASIGAVGLINNLAVKATGKKGHFDVVAGGRRLTALQALVKSGALKATDTVPCRVIEGEGGHAEVVSLSENIHRQAMHPADEFVAFQTLIDAGLSVKEVAAQFGTTGPAVNKRLKLAGVAPQILAAYRKGDMDLECVMAFTVEAEHTRQLAVWKAIKGGHVGAHSIRKALTEGRLPDGFLGVVGLDATCTTTPTRSSRQDIEGSALEAAMTATREKLSLGWLGKTSDAKKFEAYSALKPKEKAAITAYCAAQSLKGQLADGGNAVIETALNRCEIDYAQHWRPTAENFFSRITKSALLALGDELAGDDWAHSHKHLKKGELAERLEALTQGQGAALSKDQQAACLAWMPKGF